MFAEVVFRMVRDSMFEPVLIVPSSAPSGFINSC